MLLGTSDGTVFQEHTKYPLSKLNDLTVDWKSRTTTLNTLIIYDEDAPYPSRNTMSPYLHLLLTNIPDSQIEKGSVIMPYTPPSPPQNSEPHHYVVAVYNQHKKVENPVVSKRDNFSVQNLTKAMSPREQKYIIVFPSTREFYISDNRISITPNPNHPLIIQNSMLSEDEQKFCSCVVDVAVKQPGSCNLEKAWFEERESRTCYNPYAVCARQIGTSTRNCDANYNFKAMTDRQLTALMNLKGRDTSSMSRGEMITTLAAPRS